jgi:hypothetical protein
VFTGNTRRDCPRLPIPLLRSLHGRGDCPTGRSSTEHPSSTGNCNTCLLLMHSLFQHRLWQLLLYCVSFPHVHVCARVHFISAAQYMCSLCQLILAVSNVHRTHWETCRDKRHKWGGGILHKCWGISGPGKDCTPRICTSSYVSQSRLLNLVTVAQSPLCCPSVRSHVYSVQLGLCCAQFSSLQRHWYLQLQNRGKDQVSHTLSAQWRDCKLFLSVWDTSC